MYSIPPTAVDVPPYSLTLFPLSLSLSYPFLHQSSDAVRGTAVRHLEANPENDNCLLIAYENGSIVEWGTKSFIWPFPTTSSYYFQTYGSARC
jgi:hypothetical protein